MPTFDIRDDEQEYPAPAYTPGPWAISSISQETGEIGIAKDGVVIAYATNAASFGDFINATLKGRKDFGSPDTAHTQFANARLMAAAPELDAALQTIIDWADFALRNPEVFDSNGVLNLEGPPFDAARAVLAKAKGIAPSPDPRSAFGGGA